MDNALKARLIGATVLVAIAVLLIPELLTGRKESAPTAETTAGAQGTRTFTIELSGSPSSATTGSGAGASAAPAAPVVSKSSSLPPSQAPTAGKSDSRPPSMAVPPTNEPAATGSESPPVVAAAPAPSPQPPSAEAAPAASAKGGWAVQVGAFASAATAQKLARKLQAEGYSTYVSPVTRDGKTLHRVRVGPESERVAAENLVGGLKSRGLPATVVAND
jgi:DedD protein